MATFKSQAFGTVRVENDGTYVKAETSVRGRRLVRSLFVAVSDQALLDRAAALVDDLDRLDERARDAIRAAHEGADGAVRAFIDFHFEALDGDILSRVFDVPDALGLATVDRHAAFLAKLELVGVAVHPSSPDGFSLVLDYSLGRDVPSDELLAVRFTTNAEAVAVTHES